MNYKEVIKFFNLNSKECYAISCEEEMKKVINKNQKYIYFIHWSHQDIYSWGTMSGSSNRLRKSSIMNKKLTGKYDRRVDYLMLLKIYGFEKIEARVPKMVSFISECVGSHSTATCNVHDTLF